MNEMQSYLVTKPSLRGTVISYLVKGDRVLLGVRTLVSNDLGYLTVASIGDGIEDGETPGAVPEREV